jgi:dolichol-phosphate mannosyltransferase
MLFVILPAYNELQALPSVLKDLQLVCAGIDYRLVVVDDGSTDGTGELLQSLQKSFTNLDVITHEVNKGLGKALYSGFCHAVKAAENFDQGIGDYADIIVTMDADNTHPADRIPLLCHAIQTGADVVVASRFIAGGKQSGIGAGRRLLSWGAGIVMRFFFPVNGLYDYSCGYRAYRLRTMSKAIDYYGDGLIECRSFAASVELLLKIIPFCRCIKEVPLVLHYERKKGMSKMRIWATVWEYLQIILRMKRGSGGPVECAEQ